MNKKMALVLISYIFAVMFCSCTPQAEIINEIKGKYVEPSGFCGNNECEGPENENNCPIDCAGLEEGSGTKIETSEYSDKEKEPILMLGIMVHLEGWEREIIEKEMFDQHVKLMREYADLFEKYNAKLTWETIDIAKASNRWGENVLFEMEERGHGIGVHADLGGNKDYNCDLFTKELSEMKLELENLGVDIKHASGIVSHCDWVEAMVDAGYEFTTGMVAYGVMSMPMANRPEEFKNCKNPKQCHDTFPELLEDRLHPWRMNSGLDWINHDPNGKLVMLPSSQGLACYEEENNGLSCNQEFTQEDIQIFFNELDQAIALSNPDKVNLYYVSWSLGKPLDSDLLEIWLEGIDKYISDGKVKWTTLPEMYDAYLKWEENK